MREKIKSDESFDPGCDADGLRKSGANFQSIGRGRDWLRA